jgi:predicted outer membrane lipoprotein
MRPLEMGFALVICQVVVVIFLVFHDWVPLGKLNNMAGLRAVDSGRKLVLTTAVSTLPFAAVLVVSTMFAPVKYPNWLLGWLWGTYLVCAYGILRAWWIPYLGAVDPERAKRYGIRFAGTHSFLPERNGIRPDTLHVAFHALILVILGILAFLTWAQR